MLKWVFYIILAIIILFVILSFLKLKIKLDILHSQDDDYITIKGMLLFGLISYTYTIPFVKVDEESASLVVKNEQKIGAEKSNKGTPEKKVKISPSDVLNRIKQTKEFLDRVINLHSIVKKFMGHISIHKLEWKSSFGFGDAAYTGMAMGVIWSLKGGIVGLLSNYMKLKSKPELEVIPLFQEKYSHTRLTCIFSFRIGYAIGAVLRIMKSWKSTKGGKQHGRASNSGFNDNSYGKFEAND